MLHGMHPRHKGSVGVVILAGGEASRLPGKLELDAGGMALIVRVFRNVRDAGPVYVSANRSFPGDIDMALDCPVIIDRWPRQGPLAGLYTTLEHVREAYVFVTAADMPHVHAAVAEELAEAWENGVQAVVPVNAAGRLEPLCALYERAAFLDAAAPLLRAGSGGVAAVVERLKAKRVRLSDERVFASVNTVTDRRNILQV
jgi:molybdopterin-guanine dinucleotide biosynthesis protein A